VFSSYTWKLATPIRGKYCSDPGSASSHHCNSTHTIPDISSLQESLKAQTALKHFARIYSLAGTTTNKQTRKQIKVFIQQK